VDPAVSGVELGSEIGLQDMPVPDTVLVPPGIGQQQVTPVQRHALATYCPVMPDERATAVPVQADSLEGQQSYPANIGAEVLQEQVRRVESRIQRRKQVETVAQESVVPAVQEQLEPEERLERTEIAAAELVAAVAPVEVVVAVGREAVVRIGGTADIQLQLEGVDLMEVGLGAAVVAPPGLVVAVDTQLRGAVAAESMSNFVAGHKQNGGPLEELDHTAERILEGQELDRDHIHPVEDNLRHMVPASVLDRR